jgi:NADH dehydrogenase FAD-containing subunit/uncharacterized membrane protein YphA (DoxX/SURF4 family)
MFVLAVFLLLLMTGGAVAHEAWVLSPEKIAALNAKPLPEIFTTLNATNISMYLITVLFLVGWISLNYTGARELFPDLQVRLGSYGGYASLGLRIALGVLLGMAGTGLGPRVGTAPFVAPTLAAPDLELRLLGSGWGWIAWVEIVLAVCFLLGIYVRAAAAVLLGLAILGLFTFGPRMLDYLGLIGGAGVYLLLQGAGSYHVPMPSIPGTAKIQAWLESQPRLRAQFLLQLLAGFNLAYLGISWKGFQANCMLAILQEHHVPTFGIDPPTFVLLMALVEGLSGLLIMAGVLMRPLSIVLFASFIFFSVILGESVFGHIIFYGLLVSFITNGDGRWRRPVAVDKPGRFVILGGSFAGVHCAMRLERLLGEYTNVEVTLVHNASYFLFQPLLAEVVGGGVQPGSIVNSIRRLCPRTHLLQGEVTAIDYAARQVQVHLQSGEGATVDYDQLVIALDPEASFSSVPGLLEHALPMMTIGDALFLRQQVLNRMGEAERISDAAERRALLTFAVIGGGLRGTATAAEIRALINSALVSYPGIPPEEPRVLLFEENPRILPRFAPAIESVGRRRLEKLGVEIFTGTRVSAVTPEEVVLPTGPRVPCRSVVGALAFVPQVVARLPWGGPDERLSVDEFFRVRGAQNVLAVGDSAGTRAHMPLMAQWEIRTGRCAAYNTLALHRGYKLLRCSEWRPRITLAALGRYATVATVVGLRFSGLPAWILSRAYCLLTLPGLERNLRVLVDWFLDIPFRHDIVVLAPQRTQKLGRAHYEPGDDVVRQGDKGDCAYLLLDGEVEVCRQTNGTWQQVARLKSGECFGEIALLADVPRTATVRCLTSVDLLVLPRDQFMALTRGYRDLEASLKVRMSERMVALSQIFI